MKCGRISCRHDRAAHAIHAVDASGMPHGACSQCLCPGFVVPAGGEPPTGAIGSSDWPGLLKLIEESGETLQLAGKVLAYPDGEHPDGTNIIARLANELADLDAIVKFVANVNPLLMSTEWVERRNEKLRRFFDWHENERPEVTHGGG